MRPLIVASPSTENAAGRGSSNSPAGTRRENWKLIGKGWNSSVRLRCRRPSSSRAVAWKRATELTRGPTASKRVSYNWRKSSK